MSASPPFDRQGVWDTHIHLLDPQTYPYADGRTYTPARALPEDLLTRSLADNFLVVQASVENGHAGLLAQLSKLQQQHPHRTFMAEIVYEDNFSQHETVWSDRRLDLLHQAGVRCLRVRNPTASDAESMAKKTEQLLYGRLGQIAKQKNWTIAMQLPLQTWAALAPVLEPLLRNGTKIVAEHVASIEVPLSPRATIDLETFVRLLRRQKNLCVKLGALHRRIDRSRGGTTEYLKACVRTIADAAGPYNLLWGSDWPHVNTRPVERVMETAHLEIDEREELSLLREWLTEEQVKGMLTRTPMELFGW